MYVGACCAVLLAGCVRDGSAPKPPAEPLEVHTAAAPTQGDKLASWPMWGWSQERSRIRAEPSEPFGFSGVEDHMLHRDAEGRVTALVASAYTPDNSDSKTERWRLQLEGSELAQAMYLTDEAVLIGTLATDASQAFVRAVSRDKGTLLWTVKIPAEGLRPDPRRSVMRLGYTDKDNLVRVSVRAARGDHLLHIELDSGKVDGRWSPPIALTRVAWRWRGSDPRKRVSPRGARSEHAGAELRYALDPAPKPPAGFTRQASLSATDAKGRKLWSSTLEVGLAHRAEMRERGDRLLVLVHKGQGDHPSAELVALSRRSGEVLWVNREVHWSFSTESRTDNWVGYELDVVEGYPVVYALGGIGKRAVVVHPDTGETLVTHEYAE